MNKLLSRLLICLLLSAEVGQCQQLTIQTEGGKQTVLVRSDIDSLPHVTVTTHDSDTTNYEGVTLNAVLEKAGVEFEESLRGKRMASCLVVEAADGYRVVIAKKEGPYRMVIPDEKRMARWVRQVTTLKIVNVQ